MGLMAVAYCKVRAGEIKLISTGVTLPLPYSVCPWKKEGKKTFALGKERGELQRAQWYPTSSDCSLCLITLEHAYRDSRGNARVSRYYGNRP